MAIGAIALSFAHFEPVIAQSYNLAPNPGFEEPRSSGQGPAGWTASPRAERSHMDWEQQGGATGRAVSISGPGAWKARVEGLIPGRSYLLSLRLKREGWRDGEYPLLKVFGREILLNETWSYGGWMPVSRILKAPSGETEFWLINPGLSHKLWFDEVRLEELYAWPTHPVAGVATRCRRPTFEWRMTEDERVYEVEVELSRSSIFEATRSFKTYSPLGPKLVPSEPLEPGLWYWRLKVDLNGRRISTSSPASFVVEARADDCKSKPKTAPPGSWSGNLDFFPLGIYSANPEVFGELKAAGFNSVQTYANSAAQVKAFVAAAERHGLKALIRVPKEVWKWDPVLSAHLMRRLRSSPALLAWYLADEPEGRAVPPGYLWKVREYIRWFDTSHPTAIVVLRGHKAHDYAPATDVLMVDPYPIPKMPVTWLSDTLDEARRAVGGDKPVWAVIQAFDRSEVRASFSGGRLPTYKEERLLAYLSVVHGASGLFFFKYGSGSSRIMNHPGHWRGVKRLGGELSRMEPLLLAPEVSQGWRARVNGSTGIIFPAEEGLTAEESVHFSVKRLHAEKKNLPAGTYLIAVNVSQEPVRVTFKAPGPLSGEARVLAEEKTIPFRGSSLADTLGPMGVRIYYLEER